MTQEEIKAFAGRLKTDREEGGACFGIYKYAGSADEVYIKANKGGLQLFAAEILRAIALFDETITDNKNIIPIEYHTAWLDKESDTCIQYVEPVINKSPQNKAIKETGKLKGSLINVGCIAGLAFVLVATVTGIITILKWLF